MNTTQHTSESAPGCDKTNDALGISMVVFDTEHNIVQKSIDSIFESNIPVEITLIDNSEKELYKDFSELNKVNYIANEKNIGYGCANNLSVKNCSLKNPFHVIMNPDVILNKNCLNLLSNLMSHNSEITVTMPKVLNADGSLQDLHCKLPRPFTLLSRRFLPRFISNKFRNLEDGIQKSQNYNTISVASGAFMFFRKSAYLKIGGFDERFFLYLEDIDLSKRIVEIGPIAYCPKAEITHYYARHSYNTLRSLVWHCISATQYFNKWGWWPLFKS